jgi:hypothetical protein
MASNAIKCGFESHPGHKMSTRRDGTVGAIADDRLMYPRDAVELARLLSCLEILDRENAVICGVSIAAVRHWRRGSRRMPGTAARSEIPRCPRCHARALNQRAYSYLLGLYLGDGHITQGRSGDEVFRQLVLARARRTLRGIDEQVAKAEKAVAGKTPVKRSRFIQLSGGTAASTGNSRPRPGRWPGSRAMSRTCGPAPTARRQPHDHPQHGAA